MPVSRSIEVRLAAWYSLLLVVGLTSLGAALWLGVSYSLTASVDDALEERIRRLSDYVAAEFGNAQGQVHIQGDEAEIKGVVDRLDAEGGLLVIGGTEVLLTPETDFDRGTGVSSTEDLKVGQYLGVELSQEDSRWFAEEISLEGSFESELREELSEFLMASPDGRWIRIRAADGEPFLPVVQADGKIPWLGEDRVVRTIELEDGARRVLQDSALFAGSEFQVQTSTPLDAVIAAQRRLVRWLLWALPIGLLLSLGGGYWISRSALRPVEDVVSVAETMDLNRLSERLPVSPTGDVVERLARTFNSMLDRLEGSVRRLDEFTADASHELRSPVSVIRTTAELALRHARSPGELQQDMREIQQEAARLSELLEDLLTLARSGSSASAPEKRGVDLAALVVDVAEQHQRIHPKRIILMDVPDGETTVAGHELSLRRLLSILLDNAIRHTPEQAEVEVSLSSGETCRLTVADTGDGIPPEQLDRVFARFYRADSSRDRSDGGFGLGLAIGKWIAQAHGARIGVDSTVGKGATFFVEFPPVGG